MKDKEIMAHLHHADDATLRRIAHAAPATGKATRSRLYRTLHARRNGEDDAVTETFHVETAPRMTFGRYVAIAAALALAVGCAALGTSLLRRPALLPGGDIAVETPAPTTETQETAASEGVREDEQPSILVELARRNAADMPWQGHVILAAGIGGLEFTHVEEMEHVSPDDDATYPAIQIWYQEGAERFEDVRSIAVTYSALPRDTDGALTPENIPDDPADVRLGDGQLDFVIACGTFSVEVYSENATEEEQRIVLAMLRNAFTDTDIQDATDPLALDAQILPGMYTESVTYAEAAQRYGAFLPDEDLGAMHFVTGLRDTLIEEDGGSYTCDRLTYASADGERALTLTLMPPGTMEDGVLLTMYGDDHTANDPAMPQMAWDAWSMKTITAAPYAETVDDRLQKYAFWVDMDGCEAAFLGTVTIDEIGVFANSYSLVNYRQRLEVPERYATPAELDQEDYPWQGQLVTADEIAGLPLTQSLRMSLSPKMGELYPSVVLQYGGETVQFLTLIYTTAPLEELDTEGRSIAPEALDAETLLSDPVYRTGDSLDFFVDYGTYRLHVKMDADNAVLETLLAML